MQLSDFAGHIAGWSVILVVSYVLAASLQRQRNANYRRIHNTLRIFNCTFVLTLYRRIKKFFDMTKRRKQLVQKIMARKQTRAPSDTDVGSSERKAARGKVAVPDDDLGPGSGTAKTKNKKRKAGKPISPARDTPKDGTPLRHGPERLRQVPMAKKMLKALGPRSIDPCALPNKKFYEEECGLDSTVTPVSSSSSQNLEPERCARATSSKSHGAKTNNTGLGVSHLPTSVAEAIVNITREKMGAPKEPVEKTADKAKNTSLSVVEKKVDATPESVEKTVAKAKNTSLSVVEKKMGAPQEPVRKTAAKAKNTSLSVVGKKVDATPESVEKTVAKAKNTSLSVVGKKIDVPREPVEKTAAKAKNTSPSIAEKKMDAPLEPPLVVVTSPSGAPLEGIFAYQELVKLETDVVSYSSKEKVSVISATPFIASLDGVDTSTPACSPKKHSTLSWPTTDTTVSSKWVTTDNRSPVCGSAGEGEVSEKILPEQGSPYVLMSLEELVKAPFSPVESSRITGGHDWIIGEGVLSTDDPIVSPTRGKNRLSLADLVSPHTADFVPTQYMHNAGSVLSLEQSMAHYGYESSSSAGHYAYDTQFSTADNPYTYAGYPYYQSSFEEYPYGYEDAPQFAQEPLAFGNYSVSLDGIASDRTLSYLVKGTHDEVSPMESPKSARLCVTPPPGLQCSFAVTEIPPAPPGLSTKDDFSTMDLCLMPLPSEDDESSEESQDRDVLASLYKASLEEFFEGADKSQLTDSVPLDPSIASKEPKQPTWSLGAEKHFDGQCQPCGFYYKKLCRNGSLCVYCHMCPKTELKRRKKDKMSMPPRTIEKS